MRARSDLSCPPGPITIIVGKTRSSRPGGPPMRGGSWLVCVLLLLPWATPAPGQVPGKLLQARAAPADAASDPVAQDEQALRAAGLRGEGPALVEFFRQRAEA